MKKNLISTMLVIIISLMCIFMLASCKAAAKDNPADNNVGENPSHTVETEAPVVETEAPVVETEAPAAQDIYYEAELSNGNYTAGIDFPEGKYDIEAVSGGGNVFSDNMFSGGINATMGVEEENEIADIYEQKYSNIELPEGTVLTISGGVTVKISSDKASGEPLKPRVQPNTETVTLENGNFVAGEDFPAGVYDVVAVDGTGNVSSDNMFEGGINAIMGISDMDMYEVSYKNISLTEGVMLKISGVTINLVPSK